ncbi:MAG: ribonuclease III [Rhodospirillales bacterium]|nr:ribonuclease III [Rhodospirillales bacterium]
MNARRRAESVGPAAVEESIGHRFRDPSLLSLALTHASARGADPETTVCNERLEFLGDRVLGLVIADLLYRRFPDESEGALAQRHAAVVSRPALSLVAMRLELSPWIVASRSERDAGGTSSPGILADTLEAIIGALYLDGGLEAAAAFIAANWSEPISEAQTPPKDAKTELQEWAQARGIGLPLYREVDRRGPPHAPEFSIEVSLPGIAGVLADGPSKRSAEQAAAERLLASLHKEGAGGGRTSR